LKFALPVAAPERPADKVLVLAFRIIAKAVNTVVYVEPIPSVLMVILLAISVTDGQRLRCSKVPLLLSCDLV
jgi:hypothetical protein